MKDKYVEEDFSRYYIFGKHPSGIVDVSDMNRDIVTRVSLKEAEYLVADRGRVVDALIDALNGHPDPVSVLLRNRP